MFTIIDYVILAALALSFLGNLWFAYSADRYETLLKKVVASYWHAYRDLADGKSTGETLDNLMDNIDIILKY